MSLIHSCKITKSSFRWGCGSDHALLECILQFGSRPKVCWNYQEAVHYDIKESSYSNYQANLDLSVETVPLHQFSCLTANMMLPHISETINQSAMKTFGLKVKKRKPCNKLPQPVIILIKAKTALAQDLHRAQLNSNPAEAQRLQQEFDSLKAKIRDSIADVKLQRRHRLRTKLLKADPSRKKFWSFLKSQIKAAGNISAVYDTANKVVFAQEEIEEAVLNHFGKIFKGQRVPVYSADVSISQVDLAIQELDLLIGQGDPTVEHDQYEEAVCSPYTFLELDQILSKLPSGKASGYDQIPNEMLTHSSFTFKQYLLIFLNKVLADGRIPEDLNLGKCILIFKVYYTTQKLTHIPFTIQTLDPGWRRTPDRPVQAYNHPIQHPPAAHGEDVYPDDRGCGGCWIVGS